MSIRRLYNAKFSHFEAAKDKNSGEVEGVLTSVQ